MGESERAREPNLLISAQRASNVLFGQMSTSTRVKGGFLLPSPCVFTFTCDCDHRWWGCQWFRVWRACRRGWRRIVLWKRFFPSATAAVILSLFFLYLLTHFQLKISQTLPFPSLSEIVTSPPALQISLRTGPGSEQAGCIHYSRVPPEYWEDRILRLKAMGLV